MPGWKSYVKNDTLEWLLEDNNPSVKYFALKNLLDKNPDSPEVRRAQARIMMEGPVPKILSKQKPGGFWGDSLGFYLPKRKATIWQFYQLVELGADGNDERIRRICEYMLENSQHKESGAFSFNSYERLRKISANNPTPSERVLLKNLDSFSDDLSGGSSVVAPCITGQILFSLIRCGYLEDPRIQRAIDWIVKYQRFDDGDTQPLKEWPYKIPILRYGDSCWGKHTCHTGVVLVLRALSEIPKAKRSREVKHVIERASEHMLKHHIYKRSHNLKQVSIPAWTKLGYPSPLDFLAVLLILSKLGYKDDRMKDAVDLLLSKQNKSGRWPAEKPGFDPKGKESKWITLNALISLKNFYG